MLQNGVVKLEVNSPVVRDALLDGCAWVIQFEKENREESTQHVNGFTPEWWSDRWSWRRRSTNS